MKFECLVFIIDSLWIYLLHKKMLKTLFVTIQKTKPKNFKRCYLYLRQ